MKGWHRVVLALVAALLAIDVGLLTARLAANGQPEEVATSSTAIGGPFTLVATDGRTVTAETFSRKWLLVYFGYTHCPDACPTALANIGEALRTLGPDAGRVQALFITVDPERDTRELLSRYMKAFDPRILALTGSGEQTAAAVEAYRVYYTPQRGNAPRNDYLVDHSSYIYLMNPAGRFVKVVSGASSGKDIANALRKAMNASA